MDRYSLPHGAKGIEGEGFAISLSDDKIVFISRSRPESLPAEVAEKEKHYTLHAGPASGVLDLHETTLDADGQEQHRTLFALRRDDLPAILGEFAPMLPELFDLIRPLRLGWLHHNNIGIARGVNPVSDEDIAAVTRKRSGRSSRRARTRDRGTECGPRPFRFPRTVGVRAGGAAVPRVRSRADYDGGARRCA
jgi:hypothetical protein